jgi:porin
VQEKRHAATATAYGGRGVSGLVDRLTGEVSLWFAGRGVRIVGWDEEVMDERSDSTRAAALPWQRRGRRYGALLRMLSRGTALLVAVVLAASPSAADDAEERPSVLEDGPLLERPHLTGGWGGLRQRLADAGFVPYLQYTGSMWSNVGGGIRTGTEFDGYLDTGFGLDLNTIGLWDGLKMQASLHWFQGREPSAELVGVNLSQAVNPWEASNAIRVFDLYLSQKIGDAVTLRAGQLAVDSFFMISKYAGMLLNAAFGDLPSQNLNLDVPVYPVAGPGIYASAKLGDDFTGRLGLFSADTPEDRAGFHGLDWKLGHDAGWATLFELAYKARPAALPGTYTLGGYAAAAHAQFGNDDPLVGKWSFWLMVDQALAVDAKGDPSVGGFVQFSYTPDEDRNVVSYYAGAGLNVFGPIPGRDDDVLAFGGSVMGFTDAFLESAEGPGPGASSSETVLEIGYQITATQWLVVQPDLQYVIDPQFAEHDATVLGVEMVLTF